MSAQLHGQSKNYVVQGLVLWVDTGEYETHNGWPIPIYTFLNLPLRQGMTLEEALQALPEAPDDIKGEIIPEEIRLACVRLACTICLLGNDPDLIEPDVLNKDQGKELTQAIIDRAKRRGKFGFNIGKGIEVIPHVRRPHPALVWTGQGRKVPKIVLRKGCVVHRETVMRIPTGFQA